MPNKEAVRFLEAKSVNNANFIVARLIEGGFIEDIPLSEPERLAEGAKQWLGLGTPYEKFETATGWSTEGWRTVMSEKFQHPAQTRQIFHALVILAKEAGLEL